MVKHNASESNVQLSIHRRPELFKQSSAVTSLAATVVAALIQGEVIEWDWNHPYAEPMFTNAVRIVAAALAPVDKLLSPKQPIDLPFDW